MNEYIKFEKKNPPKANQEKLYKTEKRRKIHKRKDIATISF